MKVNYLYIFETGEHYNSLQKVSVEKLISIGLGSKFYLFKITDQVAVPDQQFEEIQIERSGVFNISELRAADSWSPEHHLYGKDTGISIICPSCKKTAKQKVKDWIKPKRIIYQCKACGKSFKEVL